MTKTTELKHDTRFFEISGLVDFVWDSRTWIFIGVLSAIMALAAVAVARYLTNPPLTTYRAAIQLDFPEVQDGTYPNGTSFSLRDVISNQVLRRVHEQKKLGNYDLSYEDFSSAVSIAPYDPAFDELVDRYREQLNDRRLSTVERSTIEERMSKEMGDRALGKALISVTLGIFSKVPDSVASLLPVEIAKVWQTIAQDMLKIYQLDRSLKRSDVVNIQMLSQSSFPIQVQQLSEGIERVRVQIGEMMKIPGARTIQDPKTGLQLDDLVQSIDDIETLDYQRFYGELLSGKIGLNPESTIAHLAAGVRLKESHLDQLRKRAELLERMIETQRIDRAISATAATGSASANRETQASNTDMKSDGDVLDRLVKLARDNELIKFFQRLVNDRLSLDEQLASIEAAVTRQAKDVALLRSLLEQQKADISPLTTLQKSLIEVAQRVNEKSGSVTRITDVIRTSTALGGHRLYLDLLVSPAKVLEIPGLSKISLQLVPVAGFLGGMLGFLGYAFHAGVARAQDRRRAVEAEVL